MWATKVLFILLALLVLGTVFALARLALTEVFDDVVAENAKLREMILTALGILIFVSFLVLCRKIIKWTI
ncbi:MAG TPA: hypothetical protein DCX07_05080 [Phycisphaerales bacterium]|nr:hypothetical protein [Phycisphaerales bacterium]